MKPPKKPLLAPSLAQRVKQFKPPAHGFKPAIAQFKTASSFKLPAAPPVYRPQPTPRVLQTKRSPGQLLQSGQITGAPSKTHLAVVRPAAPPVYRPQPVPMVLQRKVALKPAGAASTLLRNAVQPKAMTKPATMHMPMAGTRLPVVQMAARARRAPAPKAEDKKEAKKVPVITSKGLEKDDYLYVDAATGGVSENPENTVKKMDVRVLKLSDIDYHMTARFIKMVLTTPKPFRNTKSDCAIHKNKEERLPTYSDEEHQPNLEYIVPSLGGSRIVVDVTGGRVYLSHHYGDKSAMEKKIPAKYKGISAHVELDASWDTAALIADAIEWWEIVLASLE